MTIIVEQMSIVIVVVIDCVRGVPGGPSQTSVYDTEDAGARKAGMTTRSRSLHSRSIASSGG